MNQKNQTSSETPARTIKSTYPKKVMRFLVVVVFILAACSVYFYRQYSFLKKTPADKVQDETAQIIEKVGKLIVLPAGTPTIATVTDVEKLRDQAFFDNAQNGYKVLIFTEAKKAILYDPVSNKIVEVAPINIGNNQTKQSAIPTPVQKPEPLPVTETTSNSSAVEDVN